MVMFYKYIVNVIVIFCIFDVDKTIKLWKVSEKDKKIEGYNTKEDSGIMRDPMNITSLKVCCYFPLSFMP